MSYCYSHDGETFCGDCATIGDALEEARDEYGDDYEVIDIGESVKKTIGEYLNARDVETLIESISENAYDTCGDVVNGWLDPSKRPAIGRYATQEEKQKWLDDREKWVGSLRGRIEAALEEWANETDQQPRFWHVVNVKEYDIKTGAEIQRRKK